jgi:hypothetical protein
VEQGPRATSHASHLFPHASHSEPVSRYCLYPRCFGGITAPHDHGNTSLNRSSSAVEVTYGMKHLCRTMKADIDTPIGSSLSDRMLQGQGFALPDDLEVLVGTLVVAS